MRYVLDFEEVDRTQAALAGGKGAHLGELSRIDGIVVPPGFCVATTAFQRIMSESSSIDGKLEQLSRLKPSEHDAIREISADIRQTIEATALPDDLAAAITDAIAKRGEGAAYAVRSSATAEDLPTASFAGQHDTYLNVAGREAILQHINRCWASLFSERAVTYRLRSGFDHRKVLMAVVVQRMVSPRAAGILFTADPSTGNRTVSLVEASFGLGEALVAGLVNADGYRVRGGEVVERTINTKRLAIEPVAGGGTRERPIELERQSKPALENAEVVRLAELGRRIEAHFGRPQDIEWCLVDEGFQIVQSRPITTLFPIPAASDGRNRVYISVGHQQMMTDAMKPLGVSMRQLTAAVPMPDAGGRVFVDVTDRLASPASRAGLLAMIGRGDPLIRDALQTILDRDFIAPLSDATPSAAPPASPPAPIATDPAIPAALIRESEDSVARLKSGIRNKSGTELLDFILADIPEFKRILFNPRSHQVFMDAMDASWWLNEHLEEWLGEKSVADTLTQSVANNVTSEMGLALLDVADAIRPHAKIVEFLRRTTDENFLNALPAIDGGREAREAIMGWLDKYGMRGAGEIDITRPRWSERPSLLVPILLGHIDHFEPGEAKRRFEAGRQAASRKERDILERLRALPDGASKAEETKRMIDRVRTFIGYREYPKYGMVSRYGVYKQGLMDEADRLVQAGVIREREDIFFLTFEELREVVRTQRVDETLIEERKHAFRSYETLMPPRVLTSEGEGVAGSYRRENFPPGALLGLPVSAGAVEGRARVVNDMAEARLEPGDILVTAFTDPSWTPLFVAIKGLVTEVGGLMTHGAVIAREYGLPAVVGVDGATRLIRDGQRIRVDGTNGYVEILPDAP